MKLDEAFANLDTADIRHEAAGLDKATAATENATATITLAAAETQNTTATVTLATATATKSALERSHQLDLQIKEAQLAEALTRASLATLQLHEAQAAAAAQHHAPGPAARRKPHAPGTLTFLSMPAVRPTSKKKTVVFMEGTKAT